MIAGAGIIMQPSIAQCDLILRLAEEIPTEKEQIELLNDPFVKCPDPHEHSFVEVSFCVGLRNCAGCMARITTLFGTFRNKEVVTDPIVRCVGCGVYAHRSCTSLLRCQSTGDAKGHSKKSIESNPAQNETNDDGCDDDDDDSIVLTPSPEHKDDQMGLRSVPVPINCSDASNTQEEIWQSSQSSTTSFLRNLFRNSCHASDDLDIEAAMTIPRRDEVDEEEERQRFESSMVWTDDGPPQHWADSSTSFGGIATTDGNPKPKVAVNDDASNVRSSSTSKTTEQIPALIPHDDDGSEARETQPMKIDFKKFGEFARAFQENFFVYFKGERASDNNSDDERSIVSDMTLTFEIDDFDQKDEQDEGADKATSLLGHPEAIIATQTYQEKISEIIGVEPIETPSDIERIDVPQKLYKKQRTLSELASGAYAAYQAVRESPTARRKLGVAMVAGGLVGVAGLLMAGPVGAYVGGKVCQTLLVTSGILDNTVAVGVLIAVNAPDGLRSNRERKVLEIGGAGTNQKLVLVRPQVQIDPVWTDICIRAKRVSPMLQKAKYYLSALSTSPLGSPDTRADRYRRDVDIVRTDETELATEEKILLLASRILNDRLSLPGHVFRELTAECWKRDGERQNASVVSDHAAATTAAAAADASPNVRHRRQDAHALIIHVTATLLEVRPSFASSPAITDMTATAVESLVFGELYTFVFEETKQETRSADEALIMKFMAFDKAHPMGPNWDEISFQALATLAEVPQSQTPVDKLHYCVLFLEHISTHFLEASSKNKVIGADSLLKMVCQHLLVAKVPYLNAEIAFLEDFARDERLLRGREGYALVTMQAAVQFLNQSTDLDRDIFQPADD